MPVVSTYVERLDARIAERGIEAPLLLMKSSGGVTSTRTVRRAPVETALSGPAAGAVGAAYVGAGCGHPNLIGIDIGGTSADICAHPRRRAGPHHQRPHRRLAGRPADGRHGDDRCRRRLDRPRLGHGRADRRAARAPAPCRAPSATAAAASSRPSRTPISRSATCRPTCSAARFAARRRRRRARRSRRRVAEPLGLSLEAGGARHPRHRRQQHGRRHPRRLGRARPRPARLLAAALRRRRARCTAARWRGCSACAPSSCRRVPACCPRSGCSSPTSRPSSRAPACRRPAPSTPQLWRACSASSRPRPSPGSTPRTCPAEARRITWHASLRYQHQGFELNVPWAVARRHRGVGRRRPSPPSTGCTSGSIPSRRRTRRWRS